MVWKRSINSTKMTGIASHSKVQFMNRLVCIWLRKEISFGHLNISFDGIKPSLMKVFKYGGGLVPGNSLLISKLELHEFS